MTKLVIAWRISNEPTRRNLVESPIRTLNAPALNQNGGVMMSSFMYRCSLTFWSDGSGRAKAGCPSGIRNGGGKASGGLARAAARAPDSGRRPAGRKPAAASGGDRKPAKIFKRCGTSVIK
jgi:hypothetical protein